MNKIIAPDKAIGSCTEPRATYWAGSSDIDWAEKTDELMELIMTARMNLEKSSHRSSVSQEVSTIIDTLMNGKYKDTREKMFPGAGAMGSNHFVHSCALLGILPLACYNVAEIRDNTLGPAKFIQKTLQLEKVPSPKECTTILFETHGMFSPLWNNMLSVNFLENSFCYCSRTIDRTIKSLIKDTDKTADDYDATIVMNDKVRVESNTKNIYYMDERRGRIQNVFLTRTSGNGSSLLKPILIMKDAGRWSQGSNANVVLTNWQGDKNDKKLLQWKHNQNQFCLNSVLNVAEELVKMYSL